MSEDLGRDRNGRVDMPPAGAVAWLDVSADSSDVWNGRLRTGPLGLQIAPLRHGRGPYFFKGARLRGTRCIWSASTVSGAELYRPARSMSGPSFERGVQVLARMEGGGSVFDPVGTGLGIMKVFDPADEVAEQFVANSHLFTLNIPLAAIGIEPATVRGMRERTYDLTPFQSQLLRTAVSLLLVGGDELRTSSSLVGVDRYLAAMAALLLRTAVPKSAPDLAAGRAGAHAHRRDHLRAGHRPEPDPGLDRGAAEHLAAAALPGVQRHREPGGPDPSSPPGTGSGDPGRPAPDPGHVERVALECGFASAEYFSRAFRREFGLSPRAYRSAHRDATAR